ncbi:hypothetical protein GWK47_037086 [Chionoecetes opilio]|uniref:THAP-type domain-containing protein n=1 Tax=Chionoecetes opilio TaxID=41210 RepID=A0A8J5CYU1_CHIOP|nr:hypothetical protein GWK47_037086 [Chionoecetes opilio]
MVPSVKSGSCCACGKKRSNHPGIRLHLFPRDGRRRMQWMRTLDIAFERSSQTICEDHFDAKWLGTRGKLVGNADPRPADGLEEQQPQTCLECPDAPSMAHAIDAALMSEMQHLSLEYDATPFGVLSFSSEDHQVLHTPVSSVRASSLAEDASFRADLGSDWDDTNGGGILQSNAPESSSLTPNRREDTLLHLDHGQGISNGPIQPLLIAQNGRVLSTP